MLRRQTAMRANITLPFTRNIISEDAERPNVSAPSEPPNDSNPDQPPATSQQLANSATLPPAALSDFEYQLVAAVIKKARDAIWCLGPNYNPLVEEDNPNALRTTGSPTNGSIGLASGVSAVLINTIHHDGVDFEVIHLKRRYNKGAKKWAARIDEALSPYTLPIWGDAHQCKLADTHCHMTIAQIRSRPFQSHRNRPTTAYKTRTPSVHIVNIFLHQKEKQT